MDPRVKRIATYVATHPSLSDNSRQLLVDELIRCNGQLTTVLCTMLSARGLNFLYDDKPKAKLVATLPPSALFDFLTEQQYPLCFHTQAPGNTIYGQIAIGEHITGPQCIAVLTLAKAKRIAKETLRYNTFGLTFNGYAVKQIELYDDTTIKVLTYGEETLDVPTAKQ